MRDDAWRRELISALMPWKKSTDLGIARKFGITVADSKRLRKRIKAQIKWQCGAGPEPGDKFMPVKRRAR